MFSFQFHFDFIHSEKRHWSSDSSIYAAAYSYEKKNASKRKCKPFQRSFFFSELYYMLQLSSDRCLWRSLWRNKRRSRQMERRQLTSGRLHRLVRLFYIRVLLNSDSLTFNNTWYLLIIRSVSSFLVLSCSSNPTRDVRGVCVMSFLAVNMTLIENLKKQIYLKYRM